MARALIHEDRARTTWEFFENMLNSDYVLCVRWGGNFSVRGYETLAMARIPLFVDTDGLLPLDGIVDGKRYVVWADQKEIPRRLPELLGDFHAALHPDDFAQRQLDCRALWKDRLSFTGFWSHLGEMIGKAAM